VLERCTVLDAQVLVPLGRGRGVKKIENFHSRSEPEYRGDIACRVALGESRNTAAMRAGARAGIKNVIDLACVRPHVDVSAHGRDGNHLHVRRIRIGRAQPFEHVVAEHRRKAVRRLQQSAVLLQERENRGCRMHPVACA
jgi:hypothetical protein